MTNEDFWGNGYVPRVAARSFGGVELALTPDLFGGMPSRPRWAVVDAPTAETNEHLVSFLRDSGVGVLIDTQAWRYADQRTWESTRWADTPYAPNGPFTMAPDWVTDYVAGDLEAQKRLGATAVILPNWFSALRHDAAQVFVWALDGYRKFRRSALHKAVVWMPMRLNTLDQSLDIASLAAESGEIEAIIAQFERISPLQASVGQLASTLSGLVAVQDEGLPVLAGRFGSIGVTARAFGVKAAECGPAEEQTFDAASMIRSALPRANAGAGGPGGPPAAPIWFSELGQTVLANRATKLRQIRRANAEILCRRPCHQYRIGKETLTTSARHGLLSRLEEADQAQSLPPGLRLDAARRHLDRMGDAIDVVNRAVEDDGCQWQLKRDHVTTQQAVLTFSAHGAA